MATIFKTIPSADAVATRTLLHESIPVTGTIISGTYSENNILNYSHGMFQSVYDYPYLSSSANHIFDLTTGYPAASGLSGANSTQNSKKINIYNEMAQVLMGFDETRTIRRFDQDGDLTGGTKIDEAYFLNLTRLLTKDEIKKGSFTLELGVSASHVLPFGERVTLKDVDAANNNYKINAVAGQYGILYVSNSAGTPLEGGTGSTSGDPFAAYTSSTQQAAGLVFYQAGIVVVTGSVFGTLLSSSTIQSNIGGFSASTDGGDIDTLMSGTSISGNCDQFRRRLYNLSFNNTTELNSTIYFCRVNHGDFNFSSNPTYTEASKIVVKTNPTDMPVSYVTAVGLYSSDNELLAVGKLSEPLKKDPSNELTIRVRLDY